MSTVPGLSSVIETSGWSTDQAPRKILPVAGVKPGVIILARRSLPSFGHVFEMRGLGE